MHIKTTKESIKHRSRLKRFRVNKNTSSEVEVIKS